MTSHVRRGKELPKKIASEREEIEKERKFEKIFIVGGLSGASVGLDLARAREIIVPMGSLVPGQLHE
eukprot:1382917-Amorphochlora_amoeboformis.AAC.1